MRNLEIDAATTLAHILNELKTTEEDGLEITVVPGQASILENSLDRSIIEKVAAKFKKEVVLPAGTIEQAPIAEDDNLGFVEGEDIVSRAPMLEATEIMKPAVEIGKPDTNKKKFSFSLKFPKNKWALIVAGLVVLLVLLASSVLFLPTAEINLTVDGETKDSQATITASPTADKVDLEKKEIPLETTEVTKEDTEEASTTGKKTIGNSAKGRVTIFNRLASEKNYPAGTIITPVATSSATFRLDSAVLVPAAVPPGETSVGVNVTATKIGPESNLAANTSFRVGSADVSEVYAENELAFSGGSTKEAQVASSEDREKLRNDIVETLTEEAEKELKDKNKGSLIPEGALEKNITKENYEPKNVDAEAQKLKATIGVQFKTTLVDQEDVEQLLISMLEETDKNNEVDKDNLEIEIEQLEKSEDGSVKLLVKYKTTLVPKLNKDEISREVAGKTLVQTGNYLDNLEKVSSYQVAISPSIFRFVGFMPFSKDRIKVNFKTS